MWQGEVASQGFSILEGIFDLAEINELLGRLESRPLARSRAGARNGLGHSAVHLQRTILVYLASPARYFLGVTAQPFRATLFDKSPSSIGWLRGTRT